MQKRDTSPVLVVGATGKQGGSVARALLAQGCAVRALVRDPASDAAKEIESLGAVLQPGDLNDPGSLSAAVAGVRAVFSVQTPDPADAGSERTQGSNLVEAAVGASVRQFVHSSVSGAGQYHRAAPGWAEGRWDRNYWESKAHTDELVRGAGFESWTIVAPAFFMENFIKPSIFFVNWSEDELLTVMGADTVLPLVAVADIGAAVARIVDDPAKFHGDDLHLAGDVLSMSQVASTLSESWSVDIPPPSMTPDDMRAHTLPGLSPAVMDSLINMQRWFAEVGIPARPEHAAALGIRMTDFASWAKEHAPT